MAIKPIMYSVLGTKQFFGDYIVHALEMDHAMSIEIPIRRLLT